MKKFQRLYENKVREKDTLSSHIFNKFSLTYLEMSIFKM